MPDISLHKNQAQHNIDFLNSFFKSFQYNDWTITVSFYAAIHLVEAVIAHFGSKGAELLVGPEKKIIFHSADIEILHARGDKKTYHQLRGLIVQYNFPVICTEYKFLSDNSHTSRYKNFNISKDYADKAVTRCLKKVVEWANQQGEFAINFNI